MKTYFFLTQPLDQFDLFLSTQIFNSSIKNLFFKNLYSVFLLNTELNLSVYLMILFVIFFIMTSSILMKRFKLVYSSLWQYFYETFFYQFTLNILISQVGKRGQSYHAYISTLFFFILISNFIGLIPNSFTITSHIILTFMLGSTTIIGLTIIGFYKQKMHFLELFIPRGVPALLLPLLVLIEVVSYIARGFSLSIRLFANLMSGHSLIHILLFFVVKLFKVNFVIGFLSLFLIGLILLLEIGISFLQAYVFAVLVSIYLKDSYSAGH